MLIRLRRQDTLIAADDATCRYAPHADTLATFSLFIKDAMPLRLMLLRR